MAIYRLRTRPNRRDATGLEEGACANRSAQSSACVGPALITIGADCRTGDATSGASTTQERPRATSNDSPGEEGRHEVRRRLR